MSLLIVDDDKPFLQRLARAMERAAMTSIPPTRSPKAAEGRGAPPAFAVIDMRLEDGNGLDVVEPCEGAGRMRAWSC